MNISFVGRARHRVTRPTDSFVQLLETIGEVDCFRDENYAGGPAINLDRVIAGYELVVVWEMDFVVPLLAERGCANVVFVPSVDAHVRLSKRYWKTLGDTRILCFSVSLYEKLQKLGRNCVYAVYYPILGDRLRPTAWRNELSGFLCYGDDSHSINGLNKLVQNLGLANLTVQCFPDPCERKQHMEALINSLGIPIRIIDWRAEGTECLSLFANTQIYITSRLFEGGGSSFFEAMSKGMLVVAPDNPTMNEYIIHGHNGILYDPSSYESHPCRLDREDMAKKARASYRRGRTLWLGFQSYLVEWLTKRTSERSYFFDKVSHAPLPNRRAGFDIAPGVVPRANRDLDGVTVVTVVRNAVDVIECTIASVIAQTYPKIEYVIVDGDSTDGTSDIIHRHANDIDQFVSESDQGTYDAMNKAASLATGKWILFLNAGDRFISEDSLRDLMHEVPDNADIAVGHHVYHTVKGRYELRQVNDFDVTFHRLVAGTMDVRWLRGVPCHQASAIRTALLATEKYNLKYKIAADHEFMYRCKRNGAKFHLSNSFVTIYESGGASWTNAVCCIKEWREIAMEYSDDKVRVNQFYDSVLEHHHIATLESLLLMQAIRYLIRYPQAAKSVFTSAQYLKALPRHVLNRLLMSLDKANVVEAGEPSK